MIKSVSFANVPREPHCSGDVWLIEPFDEELDLWTLGAKYGFVWALLPGDPAAPRCRSLPRIEGIQDLRDQLKVAPTHIILAGAVSGDAVDIETANAMISFDRHSPIDLQGLPELVARVVDRLRDLQYYDGDARVRQFDEDGDAGGCESETFWGVVGVTFE